MILKTALMFRMLLAIMVAVIGVQIGLLVAAHGPAAPKLIALAVVVPIDIGALMLIIIAWCVHQMFVRT
jgi:hypothetical protein